MLIELYERVEVWQGNLLTGGGAERRGRQTDTGMGRQISDEAPTRIPFSREEGIGAVSCLPCINHVSLFSPHLTLVSQLLRPGILKLIFLKYPRGS